MAKTKSAHAYELELRKMIKNRTGQDCEPWLKPQVRATAMNMVMLDKIQETLIDEETDLMITASGSMGQMKQDAHPLLTHYDKLQRTLIQQFQALSLNYNATPSKVKEDTKKGLDEKDPLAKMMADAQNALED